MATKVVEDLSSHKFNAETYVNAIAQDGEEKIARTHAKIQGLAEETSVALKKNVYKNYSQFIETAKEISILEGEMYQLSHLLTDQKSVMTALMELSITEIGRAHV